MHSDAYVPIDLLAAQHNRLQEQTADDWAQERDSLPCATCSVPPDPCQLAVDEIGDVVVVGVVAVVGAGAGVVVG